MPPELRQKSKPVPNVEALRYRGTPEKPDIKIFVSHRIDLDSETIDNPLYIPIRCGAVFDERENITMLGDDTGDNISDKRLSFCELTVQYWAWKNVKADYYGLFQYRRYLSFSHEWFECGRWGLVNEQYITQTFIERYCMTEEKMRNLIAEYDVITGTPIDTVKTEHQRSVYTALVNKPQDHKIEDVDMFISLTKKMYPHMTQYVDKYFHGHYHKYYNCNILKAELFDQYCQWMFSILFQFEKLLDVKNHSESQRRIPSFMSEACFGIYYLYLKSTKKCKIKELQIIFVNRPQKWKTLLPAFNDRNIPVVLMSSNYYVPYCAVAIQSIINTLTDEWNYDLIILQSTITEENQKRLKAMTAPYTNCSLRFCDPTILLDDAKLHMGEANNIESYYRMFSPYIFPNYPKIIMMDSDLIVNRNLADLYQTDMCEKTIGAVRDATWCGWINTGYNSYRSYAENELGLTDLYAYFNTGVLILDLERFRAQFSPQDILLCAQKHEYRIQEQDALNLLLAGKQLYVDARWNVYTWGNKKHHIDSAPKEIRDDYLKAREQPYIIHYAGIVKPWKLDFVGSDMADKFWLVARQTPFYEQILERVVKQGLEEREIDNRRWHRRLKKAAIMPAFKKFFPYGSPGYVAIKSFYFKLRGWPYDKSVDVAAYQEQKR